MRAELLKNRPLQFSVRDNYHGIPRKICTATFQSFEAAFGASAKGSPIQGVHIIRHYLWIPLWTWIALDNSDQVFFDVMNLHALTIDSKLLQQKKDAFVLFRQLLDQSI